MCTGVTSVVSKAGPDQKGSSRVYCFGSVNLSFISIDITCDFCGGILGDGLKGS